MNEGAPSAVAAVRETIKGQQKQLREWYGEEIRKLKERRDRELEHLERAWTSLNGEGGAPAAPKRKAASRRRRSSRAPATPAAVRERREAVLRFLIEHERPASRSEICGALGLSSHVVRTALQLLEEEGKVGRVGTGAGTRYRAENEPRKARKAPATVASTAGTLQGGILATIQERGWASLDELVQVTGALREEVLRECEALVREGEIYKTQREGRPVYVCSGR